MSAKTRIALGSRALRLGIAVQKGQDVVNAIQAGDQLVAVEITEL